MLMRTALLAIVLALQAGQLPAATCGERGVALQVLGSGGPVADDARASSGYLIWYDGRARVLIDAGGGVFVRFGQSGAHIQDLELLALTHLHTDHAADLPALLKGGYFSSRSTALPLSGPTGNQLMPSVGAFLEAMFSGSHGAFRYLSGLLDGTDGLFALQPIELDANSREPLKVFENDHLHVMAVGVAHGPIPTLGYLFRIAGKRIAIGGDQNLQRTAFTRLAAGADIMVMPMAIAEDSGRVARNLHATPAEIGAAAHRASPKTLVVSHLMQRSLRDLDASLAEIRSRYSGNLKVAEDLACYTLGPAGPTRNSTHTN